MAGSHLLGLAPQADIVFVDVSRADIPFTGPAVVGSSFGGSVRLVEASAWGPTVDRMMEAHWSSCLTMADPRQGDVGVVRRPVHRPPPRVGRQGRRH